RRETRTQAAEIFATIGGLDLAKQPLERVEILRLDLERFGCRRRSAAAEAAKPAERGALLHVRITRHSRIGRLRLRAALPPAEDQHSDHDDESDLQQQAEDRGEACEPAKEAVAHQHADQAGAEEAAEQS